MKDYRPLYGDDKLLAPLTAEERARVPMHGCRMWVRKLKEQGRKKRARTALARHHSAFMQSVGEKCRTRL